MHAGFGMRRWGGKKKQNMSGEMFQNQHVWFPQPLCLSNEDVLLIDSRNVFKRPQGKRYCAGGTASSCINQPASLWL